MIFMYLLIFRLARRDLRAKTGEIKKRIYYFWKFICLAKRALQAKTDKIEN
jgi:hypothetical protein